MNQESYVLQVAGWYPENEKSTSGIFIKKQLELITQFQPSITLSVHESTQNAIHETKINNSFTEIRVFYSKGKMRWLYQLKLIAAFCRGYFHLQKKHGAPKLLHLHVVFPAGVFVWLLLLVNRIPLLITEHWTGYMDADGRYDKLPWLMKHITRALLHQAKGVAVVSQHLKHLLQQKFSLPEKKLVITSNVLQFPKNKLYKPTNTKTYSDAIAALYVGSIDDHHKNIGLLIEATNLLIQSTQPKLSLHLYGNGPQLEYYKSVCREQGTLDKNIFFHGSVANHLLPEIYQQHDFFVMSSKYETFSIATAEAVICGLPVVCTRCGGPEEFVHHQQGVLTEHTAESFAEGMKYIINNLLKFSTNTSATYMTEHYHPNVVTRQLKKLYQLSPE
ncbi:MAG: glycosyltransferase [Chitinophagales bacterium]|nr:glycosyltransferase [Chitinophagales bacterium]